jgi:hypothetical protein
VIFQSAKQLAVHFILLVAITCSLTTSSADTNPIEPTLAKLWAASLQAETGKNYDEALDQANSFELQGGDKFLAAMRRG